MDKNTPEKNIISKVFDNFRDKVLKTPQDKSMDNVDNILSKISTNIMNKDSMNTSEMIRKIFTDTVGNDLFKNLSSDMIFSPEIIGRLGRYSNAEEICDMLPYCARALKIIANEVVAPDKITKESLQFLQDKTFDINDKKSMANVRAINDILKIEDYMYMVIYETLKLGDQFVEICDYKSSEVPITQSVLNENNEIREEEIILNDITIERLEKDNTIKESLTLKPIIIEETPKSDTVAIDDIRLIIHDPRYVIKLQSPRFKMCLGYLVLPIPSEGGRMNTISGSSCGGYVQTSALQLYGSYNVGSLLGVDRLYSEIITAVKRKLKTDDIVVKKHEIMDMLNKVINEYDIRENLQFNIRYVPPERMEHFCLDSRRFFPYGEGIFYKSTFVAKLLAVFEAALVIKRISDSTDKRAIYIESGLPRNVRNLIEEFKSTMQKRKFSLDTNGNIGSVVSMVTNYETYYIPQKAGKRYVEFEQIPAHINIRDIHEELKVFRDQLISSLDVPPAFVNVDENTPNKNALSHESILFAKTIVGYQKQMSKPIYDLFSKIYRMIHAKKIPIGVNITFYPPRMLEIEREAEHTETVTRLINALVELGIDKEYAKKKYLSIDWDELDEFSINTELESKTKGSKEEPTGGYGAF